MSVCSRHCGNICCTECNTGHPPPHLVEGTQKSPKDEGDLITSIMKLWGSWCHFDLPQTLDLIMISQINIWLIVSLHNSITRIPVAGSIWTRLPVFSHLTILTGSEVVPIRYWFPRGNFLLILHTELKAFRHMQILRIYFFHLKPFFVSLFYSEISECLLY